jgi:hypothetical protein
VQTYADSLDIGLMACARALPETAELASFIEAAFEEFRGLPGVKTGARAAGMAGGS